jgi:hypothetical protein
VAVGKPSEVEGREEALVSWQPACPARSPATPEEGEAEWRGACGLAVLQVCCVPQPR